MIGSNHAYAAEMSVAAVQLSKRMVNSADTHWPATTGKGFTFAVRMATSGLVAIWSLGQGSRAASVASHDGRSAARTARSLRMT